jgi:hypothetical protein
MGRGAGAVRARPLYIHTYVTFTSSPQFTFLPLHFTSLHFTEFFDDFHHTFFSPYLSLFLKLLGYGGRKCDRLHLHGELNALLQGIQEVTLPVGSV